MNELMQIDARAVWTGDYRECRKLYKLWVGTFRGRFKDICDYFGWKPMSMLKALRVGSARS